MLDVCAITCDMFFSLVVSRKCYGRLLQNTMLLSHLQLLAENCPWKSDLGAIIIGIQLSGQELLITNSIGKRNWKNINSICKEPAKEHWELKSQSSPQSEMPHFSQAKTNLPCTSKSHIFTSRRILLLILYKFSSLRDILRIFWDIYIK